MPDQDKFDPNINTELRKNPQGGANIAPGGPWDYTIDEDMERNKAMERHDRGIDNPVRTIL